MAIIKSFSGQAIAHPGAYSQSSVAQNAGTPLSASSTVLIVGEADAGDSGAHEGIQSFSSAAFNQLVAKYKSGALVDAATAALTPSKTPGINGAGTILVWKTNTSVAASLALANSYGTLSALEFGIGGNRITFKNVIAAEAPATVTGSAAVTNFAGLNSETLVVSIDGAAALTCTFSSPADINAVVSQLSAALTGMTITQSGAILTLTLAAAANHHRDGFGRSFEILASSTALSNLHLVAGSSLAVSEPTASMTVTQPRDGITEANTVGGDIVLSIGRDSSGANTMATVTVNATSMVLTDSNGSTTLLFANYPLIKDLAIGIGNVAGWSATANSLYASKLSSSLDHVTSLGAFSSTYKPARLKSDAAAVAAVMAASVLVSLAQTATAGLPDAAAVANLTGGLRGSSATSDFGAGFNAALGFDLTVMVPAISQDATADIALGVTDSASTYVVESVHSLLASALILRGNVKNRREAQGVVALRLASKAAVYAQAAALGAYQIQLVMQDVLFNGVWSQAHVLAAMLAGMRCGAAPGTPLTFKFANVTGAGHYVNLATGKVGGDFNPLIDFDAAIAAGVTFLEPAQGGQRVVVDNTTYGIDASFVYNRGSVINAANYIAQNVRTDAELAFVGQKTAIVTAATIKARIRAKLIDLFNAQLMSPSSDAPQGFREDTFIVTVVGNTATVAVEVKPVTGLDFIFITFTLGESTTSA